MPQSETDIQAKFIDHGLGDYWSRFIDQIQPCIAVEYETCFDNAVAVGKSKLGGKPDLPRQVEWAVFNETPLTFLAQINLSQLPHSAISSLFPQKGILSFFFSLSNDDYASSPHKVLFSDTSDGSLERKEPPARWDSKETIYKTGLITFDIKQSLPNCESESVSDIFEQDAEKWRAYLQLSEPENPNGTTNRIMGHPSHSSGNYELICECISIGDNNLEFLPKFSDSQKDNIRDKWLLLLQIDSNVDLDMYMGVDLDCFYFWIKKDDLANKDFSKTVAFSFH